MKTEQGQGSRAKMKVVVLRRYSVVSSEDEKYHRGPSLDSVAHRLRLVLSPAEKGLEPR